MAVRSFYTHPLGAALDLTATNIKVFSTTKQFRRVSGQENDGSPVKFFDN
jgi:hypothetical protein